MQTVRNKKQEINLYGTEAKKVPFLWTEALRMGHDTIDRQHQSLYEAFRGMSQLLEMPDVNIKYWFGMVMRKTEEYALTHFTDEEQLMADLNYPDFHAHKVLHMEIVETLKKHQAIIKQLETEAEKIVEARSLLQFLNEWLDSHILVDDKKLVAFVSR